MTPDQFEAILQNPRETPALEFKGPGIITDQILFIKVVKAMIAMSNREDGGTIVLGITDEMTTDGIRRHDAAGLSPVDLGSWDADKLADKISKYTDPLIVFEAGPHTYNGKFFLVIEVREFYESPVFATKEIPGSKGKPPLLRDGGLYVRSIHKPETTQITTSAEMRSLLSVALSKHMRRHLAVSSAAGMQLGFGPSDTDLFEKELESNAPELDQLVASIMERGYWKVIVRPAQYSQYRLALSELRQIVDQCSVQLRGWAFPYVSYEADKDLRGQYWWGQGTSWNQFQETWRIFRSGQFEYIGGLHDDWPKTGSSINSQPGNIPLWGSMFRFLEIFEFASRYASTNASTPQMLVQIELMNINRRRLYQDHASKTWIRSSDGPPHFKYPEGSESFISREQLLSDPITLTAEATSLFFDTFDFRVSADGVKIWLSELQD